MILEIKNLTIGYQFPIVEDINISSDIGEVCLLIGNNGVGKTTFIKTLLNQLTPINGIVEINGQNIKNISIKEIAQMVSIVFSKSEIPLNYTVRDLVALGKYIHYPFYFKLNEQDEIEIDTIIKNLGLKKLEHLQLQQLSDGNLQKAFIGRALAQKTPIIILDEPTTHLDESNKISILNLLRKISKTEKKLIIFSSHDWRLAKEFADKIGYIKNQKLIYGVTEDILLQNQELTNPSLFDLNNSFVPPQIFAPEIQKEMLYSVLQKNFENDFSKFKFSFQDNIWEISVNNFQQKAKSFEEIISILQTID
ncbi:MAG: ABC transporter ATP-binding protein [Bacteroidetes bacterium]|nr:ABC transporter ATP-binding protein [Bacteroidota bacterium]